MNHACSLTQLTSAKIVTQKHKSKPSPRTYIFNITLTLYNIYKDMYNTMVKRISPTQ